GYGVETVAYFEGHGTGTPVGDAVELATLTKAIQSGGAGAPPAAIGSIKANLGHTKAAAGIAGLIKATLAVHYRILPPTTGVRHPRPEVHRDDAVLRVLAEPEYWPRHREVRAGVNSFGFGGINVHMAIEGLCPNRLLGAQQTPIERFTSSVQDVECLIFDA